MRTTVTLDPDTERGVRGAGGNLVSDARLAGNALEHRASVFSYGTAFGRCPEVRWSRPDDLLTE